MAFTWSDSRIESIIKLLGAFVVLLYVIGLIISNLHFMELGIADFPTLNPQNAMTGVLFLIWLTLLTALLTPPALFLLFAIYATGIDQGLGIRAFRSLVIFVVGLGVTAIVVFQIAGFSGFLLPWGSAWRSSFSAEGWTYQLEAHNFSQLAALFGFSKVATGSLFLFAALTFGIDRYLATRGLFTPKLRRPNAKFASLYVKLMQGILVVSPLGVILLFSGFSQDVFPNIKSNVGGRQPLIATLDLREADSPSLEASAGEVAIWHQSEKFIYVMPLSGSIASKDNGAPPLVAIDITLVRTIQHLRKYAVVQNGSRITFVGNMPGK